MSIFKRKVKNTGSLKAKFIEHFRKTNENPVVASGASMVFLVCAGLLALYLQTRNTEIDLPLQVAKPSIDHNIPEGHTLLPIEISNYESLDSIIGTFSTVDLYSVPFEPKKKSKKVASQVKLLKTTENSNHYAILIPIEDSANLLSAPGPYRVTIRNPNFQAGTKIEKKEQRPAQRVLFLSE